MLPGSFVERKRACGRPNCHCADGSNLHSQFQISVLIDGKPKALNIPAQLVEKVRERIEMRHRFEAAANGRLRHQSQTLSQGKGNPLALTRHRFEIYLEKVFGFSALVAALPEGRQFPQHSWKKVFDAVFLSAAMQIPSLLQIEAECRDGRWPNA